MSVKRLLIGLVGCAALLTGGLALAQEGMSSSSSDEGEVDVRQRANLTGPEQLAEAEATQQRGTQISRRIQTMLDEARRERDIIRVTCLNDKLTQTNANLRTLNDRVENLQEAVQGEDTSRRNHEYTVVTVLAQKFNTLEQEANQCIGQDLYETGATRVVTTVDPGTPDEDPTRVTEVGEEITVPFIPPPASPSI